MYMNHFKVPNINGTGVTAEVYALAVPLENLKIDTLGTSSVYNSSYHGVNGTFFGSSGLLGIAINDKSVVVSGGDRNGTSTTQRTRSTMYCRIDTGAVGVTAVHQASSLPGGTNNLKWAIGGLGLFLNESLTLSQYNNKLVNDEGSDGVGGTGDYRPRTMIGYEPNGNGPGKHMIKLVVAFDQSDNTKGIRFYDGRLIMSKLGCTQAIHLDGGSSSSVRVVTKDQDEPSVVHRYRASTVAQKCIVRSTYGSTSYFIHLSTAIPGFTDI